MDLVVRSVVVGDGQMETVLVGAARLEPLELGSVDLGAVDLRHEDLKPWCEVVDHVDEVELDVKPVQIKPQVHRCTRRDNLVDADTAHITRVWGKLCNVRDDEMAPRDVVVCSDGPGMYWVVGVLDPHQCTRSVFSGGDPISKGELAPAVVDRRRDGCRLDPRDRNLIERAIADFGDPALHIIEFMNIAFQLSRTHVIYYV